MCMYTHMYMNIYIYITCAVCCCRLFEASLHPCLSVTTNTTQARTGKVDMETDTEDNTNTIIKLYI